MKRAWYIGLGTALVLGLYAALFGPSWLRHRKWVADLRDPNPAVRAAAVRALSRTDRRHLLIGMVEDEDADVRLLAVMRLGGPGPDAPPRCRALIDALDDQHAGVRREAARSLGAVGPSAWPALEQALQDKRPRLRAGAALALDLTCWEKDPDPWPAVQAKTVVPSLEKLLTDNDPEVRRNAAQALKDIDRCRH
jgi:HEAT repeat protein